LQSIQTIDNQFKGLFDGSDDSTEHESLGSRESGERFMRLYGWIYQVDIVSEFEKISLSEVYDMPVIQFLNDLSYLKAKQHYEKQQIKNIK